MTEVLEAALLAVVSQLHQLYGRILSSRLVQSLKSRHLDQPCEWSHAHTRELPDDHAAMSVDSLIVAIIDVVASLEDCSHIDVEVVVQVDVRISVCRMAGLCVPW